MDPQALALPEDLAASEALARIRRAPRNALYYLYVVDRDGHLVGVINLRELMLAAPETLLSATMARNVACLSARADLVVIVAHPGWRHFHALPVVESDETFVGVIRYETLRRLEDAANRQPASEAASTVANLGELCWIGFGGILAGLAGAISPRAGVGQKGGNDGSER
jgi:Mg/Co/Ni transporter MgtE